MTRKPDSRNANPAYAKAGVLVASHLAVSRFGIAAPVGLVFRGLQFAGRNPVLTLGAVALAGCAALRRSASTPRIAASDTGVMADLNKGRGDVRS